MNIASLQVDFLIVLSVLVFTAGFSFRVATKTAKLTTRVDSLAGEVEAMGKSIEELRKVTENIAVMVKELQLIREVQIDIKKSLGDLTCRIDKIVDRPPSNRAMA